jgi:hypothetical protein
MYSFDGNYRRMPVQSLGGSSIETDRNKLLALNKYKRENRELLKKKENSCKKIQSWLK